MPNEVIVRIRLNKDFSKSVKRHSLFTDINSFPKIIPNNTIFDQSVMESEFVFFRTVNYGTRTCERIGERIGLSGLLASKTYFRRNSFIRLNNWGTRRVVFSIDPLAKYFAKPRKVFTASGEYGSHHASGRTASLLV
jgi:hypothetical protein